MCTTKKGCLLATFFVTIGRGLRGKYDKKAALEIIVKAAKQYEAKLNGKTFKIFYQEKGKHKTVQVQFRDIHFLHLTGVQSKLSAKLFYSACLANRLSERDFELDKKGMVQQKLQVLPYLADLLYHNCMIGQFINSGIYIQADYFVGNTRAVLSVGFRNKENGDFPVTLYKEDVRKLTNPTCKVLAIQVKAISEKEYKQYTYLATDRSSK